MEDLMKKCIKYSEDKVVFLGAIEKEGKTLYDAWIPLPMRIRVGRETPEKALEDLLKTLEEIHKTLQN